MSITIKVFYEKASGSPEIRRFPLNNGGADCFAYILTKIKHFYPVLNNENISLFWKDSDGDRVAFSSSEEMRDALEYVTDGVFRVYIPEVKKTSESSTATTTNTSNAQTQSRPRNEERPRQRPSSCQKASQDTSVLHPGVTCDGCEGPVRGLRFKCSQCPDYDLCSECDGKGLHKEHHMYMIKHPQIPFVAAQAAAHAALKAAADARASHQSMNVVKQDYLNSIGASIASFLDPFGVDVTYDIIANPANNLGSSGACHDGKTKMAANSQQPAAPETFAEKPATEEVHVTMETDQAQQAQSAGAQSPDVQIMNETAKDNDVSGLDNWTFVPDDGSEVAVSPNVINASEPPIAPAVEASQPPQSNNSSQNSNFFPQGAGGIYPNLRLQQSLEQMLSMGFTNTDGWLSNLLTENNCDIGLTLDAIKARATQQLDSLRI